MCVCVYIRACLVSCLAKAQRDTKAGRKTVVRVYMYTHICKTRGLKEEERGRRVSLAADRKARIAHRVEWPSGAVKTTGETRSE